MAGDAAAPVLAGGANCLDTLGNNDRRTTGKSNGKDNDSKHSGVF